MTADRTPWYRPRNVLLVIALVLTGLACWAVIWALSALFLPIGALAGLVAVGPFITISLANLIRNIF